MTAPPVVLQDEAGGRRFELLRELGAGGFGAVYLARLTSPTGLEQLVAVKLLHGRGDARAQPVERLQDEARLLATLRHPVILAAHDLVRFGDRIALVTEYVEGEDLARCIRHRTDPMPQGPLVEVVGQVADALAVAWRQLGTVHRDIKPANIRVGRHGNVKLLDFGVARSAQERAAATATDAVVGSFGYLGPERFDADAPPHAASDVFALGCVLYEGLVRRPLFDGLDMPMIYGLLRSERLDAFVAERLSAARIARPMRDILAASLDREPTRRPTAQDLAALCDGPLRDGPSLRSWCAAHPWPDEAARPAPEPDPPAPDPTTTRIAQTPPTPPVPAPPKPPRANPWAWWVAIAAPVAAGGVGAGALVGLVVTGIGWWLTAPALPDEPVAVVTPVPAPIPAPERAPSPPPDPPDPPVEPRAPRGPPGVPPRPVAPSAPAPGPETVSVPVAGEPGAVFYFDGEARGETNRTYALPAGDHRCGVGADHRGPLLEVGCAVASGRSVSLPRLPARVTADRAVELRGADRSYRTPDRVPAGAYAVWAEFGAGLQEAGRVDVPEHGEVVIRCNTVRGTCGR